MGKGMSVRLAKVQCKPIAINLGVDACDTIASEGLRNLTQSKFGYGLAVYCAFTSNLNE